MENQNTIFSEQEIIDLYLSGKSISELTRIQTRYNYRAIRKILSDNKVAIRGGRKPKELSQEEITTLHDEFQNGVFVKDLAQKYGLAKETIVRILNETNAPARRNNNRINKRIKSDYFSTIDSPEKAYWIGLLLTDGCVDGEKRIRLQLQSQDLELIEKFKDTLALDCKIIEDKRGSGCYSVEFTDGQMFQDLQRFGIVPKKTYMTEHLPINEIPAEYIADFCRGIFDGDGCLTYGENKSEVTFHFTTYFESMAKDYQLLIDNLINKTEHNKPFFTSCWHVQWRGRQQVLSILDKLYENSTVHLQRKYNKYLELKQSK